MSHIFVSYAHDDSEFVNKLVNDLLDHRYDVWQDALNLPGGTRWEDDIMRAIDECSFYVVVWSANMEGSGFSRKEFERADQGKKNIIPLLLSGDEKRMWSELQVLQWIDFTQPYEDGWKRLIQDIPLPSGVMPLPDIKDTIQRGEMTFNAAQKLWRSKLKYHIDGKNDAIALLVERSVQGINSYLVGREKDKLQSHPAIQVFLNFTGTFEKDRFEDYLPYIVAQPQPIWTVLVRGPIKSETRGLAYTMPYDRAVWDTALKIIWRAVAIAGTERIPIHLYANAPVALAAAFCGAEHFRRGLWIYQINSTPGIEAKDRYFLTYHNGH